jgi:hypothetical protein
MTDESAFRRSGRPSSRRPDGPPTVRNLPVNTGGGKASMTDHVDASRAGRPARRASMNWPGSADTDRGPTTLRCPNAMVRYLVEGVDEWLVEKGIRDRRSA